MLVDSHCHLDQLDLSKKEGGLATVIADAKSRGVQRILGVAVDIKSSIYLSELSQFYSCLMTSVGVHPLHRCDDNVVSIDDLLSLTELPGVVAIGETGLDKFYSSATFQWQRESFINHLQASDISGKPVIIHSSNAVDETLELLAEFNPSPRGVIHCFT
jgi:TatD DNase family protein